MKKTIYLFALAGLSLAACGDNQKATTDGNTPDTPGDSAPPPPPPPALGAQIDRMGRPTINTALNHAFDPTANAGSAKDAYNKDGSVGTWQQTWVPAFAPGIAIIDAVDTGVCGNGLCEDKPPFGAESAATCGSDCGGMNPISTTGGCGNLPTYAPNSSGSAVPTSYVTLAGILADDEMYLDTSKTACNAYLSLEFSFVTGIPVSSCGGRAPTYDVIDTSYSLLTRGLSGFDPSTLMPLFNDNATGPVTGTGDSTFPFLAAPH